MTDRKTERNPLKRAEATLSDLSEAMKGDNPKTPEAARAKEFHLAAIQAVRMAKESRRRTQFVFVARGLRALANAIYDDRERFGARWVPRLERVFDELTETAAEIMKSKGASLLDSWR